MQETSTLINTHMALSHSLPLRFKERQTGPGPTDLTQPSLFPRKAPGPGSPGVTLGSAQFHSRVSSPASAEPREWTEGVGGSTPRAAVMLYGPPAQQRNDTVNV